MTGAELVRIWDWFRNHILKAIIVAALSASAIAYFKGIFDDIIGNVFPKGAEISCSGREWVADQRSSEYLFQRFPGMTPVERKLTP
jgi:hypothetical protein